MAVSGLSFVLQGLYRVDMQSGSPDSESSVRFGPFRFDGETGRLRRGTAEVPLPPRAQALLGHLLRRPGRLVTKDELLDSVWRGVHVTDTSLKEAVHVLRQALDDDPGSPRYLETIPRKGYRFLAEVRTEKASETPGSATAIDWRRVPRWRVGWWIGGLSLGVLLAALILAQRRAPGAARIPVPQRFEIALPASHVLTPGPPNLALSPDGRLLVYVAKADGERRLFLRPLARLGASAIPGTEGASAPFFSPDGRQVGFFAAGALRRVAVAGGPAEVLSDVRRGLAASWGSGGVVMTTLDARDRTGLWHVPAAGGRPRVLTTRRAGEAAHRWPEVLPGRAAAVLFTVQGADVDEAEVHVLDIRSGDRRKLLEGSGARFAPPGHLIFVRSGRLWAVPFDLERRAIAGPEVPLLDGVATTPVLGTAHFAVASTGALVFMPRAEPSRPALRRGHERIELAVDGTVAEVRPSPDGRRLAVTVLGRAGLDVWELDLARRALSRRTFDGASLAPVWSPDGKRLLYASTKGGATGLFLLPAGAGDEAEPLWTDDAPVVATSWSEGRVAVSRLDADRGWDLWTLRVAGPAGNAEAELWRATPFDETRPAFSPDGRFLAYESDETGQREVYVRPFSGAGGPLQVSTDGGSHPLWSGDGRELWFRQGEEVFAVGLELGSPAGIGHPELRLRAPDVQGYNVALVGGEVLALEGGKPVTALHFVVSWRALTDSYPDLDRSRPES